MERIKSFDLIRAISAIMVVLFHFACLDGSSNWIEYPLFYGMGNWRTGRVAVTLFFLLSGCLLYRNYMDIQYSQIKEYYYKRWKSIFPQFYMVFLLFYFLTVIERKSFFWLGKPYLLIVSLLGMDGYLSAWENNYYMVGEWFLGAILLIYFFYPILLKIFNKFPIAFVCLCAFAFFMICYNNFFSIEIGMNMISCVFKFVCGMLFYKYTYLIKKSQISFISFVLLIFCLFNKSMHIEINEFVLGVLVFVLLFNLGDYICKNKIINIIITFTSNISFGIFLFHHKIIYLWAKVAKKMFEMNLMIETVVLILVIVTTWILAYVLNYMIKKIFNSNLYVRFEKMILND